MDRYTKHVRDLENVSYSMSLLRHMRLYIDYSCKTDSLSYHMKCIEMELERTERKLWEQLKEEVNDE